MERRHARIAENEIRFRDINERLRDGIADLTADDERVDFVCECGAASCADAVPMTVAEYEAVRRDARHFAVLAGHEAPEVERVVQRADRYVVVEKFGPSQDLARVSDPRGS